jgi:putative Holliday junction resolvase
MASILAFYTIGATSHSSSCRESTVTRILGIDHGLKRIGLAISDELGISARPHSIINRTTVAVELEIISSLCMSQNVVEIVIGLPTTSGGLPSLQGETAIRWARKVASAVDGILIRLWDESYSTEDARHFLLHHPTPARKQHFVDDVAAAILLQGYLDARETNDEPGQALDSFSVII